MLNKITAVIFGLAASSFAVAGTMGAVCTPGNVMVPCEAKQWSFGMDALYLQTVTSGARAYGATLPNQFVELNDDWDWGFRAEAAYKYNTGNDVSVSWLHYSNTDQQAGVLVPSLPLGFPSVVETASSENRIDQVNAVAGQQVIANEANSMRFYAGLQYANIQHYINHDYAATVPQLGLVSADIYDNADFKGVGPVIGMNYQYLLSPQFSVVADGSTALLYGATRLSTGAVLDPFHLVIAPGYNSKKITVPAFEAKLGVNYAHNMAQGSLNLQGGYRVVDYFNVLQSRTSTGAVVSADYALYGPYVGLKYVGNA